MSSHLTLYPVLSMTDVDIQKTVGIDVSLEPGLSSGVMGWW